MSWNPSDYGGSERILLPVATAWIPDIVLLNRLEFRTYIEHLFVVARLGFSEGRGEAAVLRRHSYKADQ